jgi:hypothetical protein
LLVWVTPSFLERERESSLLAWALLCVSDTHSHRQQGPSFVLYFFILSSSSAIFPILFLLFFPFYPLPPLCFQSSSSSFFPILFLLSFSYPPPLFFLSSANDCGLLVLYLSLTHTLHSLTHTHTHYALQTQKSSPQSHADLAHVTITWRGLRVTITRDHYA